VDDAFVAQAGFASPQAAVGQIIAMPAAWALPAQRLEIIGVVRHKPLGLIGMGATSGLYFLTPSWAQYVTVRLSRSNVPAALAQFDAAWAELAPNYPSGRQFIDQIANETYRQFTGVMALLASLAFFALMIAAMGLFGMAVHVSHRRTHEIGVRKVLGARASQIVLLLLRDFSKPVVIANLIAWPLAFLAGRLYLSLFVERTNAGVAPFLWSLIITLCIAWLAIAGQTLRASRIKPGPVLRYE
jgi:putative ABC transport system permease protein